MRLAHLEVGQLGVLLLEDVGHVVDQVQTKGILGGDFLKRVKTFLATFERFFLVEPLPPPVSIPGVMETRLHTCTRWRAAKPTPAYTYVLRRELDAGGVMLGDLCVGQLGHGGGRPCGAAYRGGISSHLRGINTKFQSSRAGLKHHPPVRARVVEGGVCGGLEVNDP